MVKNVFSEIIKCHSLRFLNVAARAHINCRHVMALNKEQIQECLRLVAHERICLSCWFPYITSFVDETLG